MAFSPIVCEKYTVTDAKDFSILQRVADGTMDASDLPAGYICKTAVIPVIKVDSKDSQSGDGQNALAPQGSSPIPVLLKLHKSCQTEEVTEEDNDEDEKVSMMQVCFPTTSAKDLHNLLETCGGDVQWATNLLLDSVAAVRPIPADDSNSHKPEDKAGSSVGDIAVPEQSPDADSTRMLVDNANKSDVKSSHGENEVTQRPEEYQQVSDSQCASARSLVESGDLNDAGNEQKAQHDPLANMVICNRDKRKDKDDGGVQVKQNVDIGNRDNVPMTTVMTVTSQADSAIRPDSQVEKDDVKEEECKELDRNMDAGSGEFEEFSNCFTFGTTETSTSKPGSSVCSTDEELPALESFEEDRQMQALAAARTGLDHIDEVLVDRSQTDGNKGKVFASFHQHSEVSKNIIVLGRTTESQGTITSVYTPISSLKSDDDVSEIQQELPISVPDEPRTGQSDGSQEETITRGIKIEDEARPPSGQSRETVQTEETITVANATTTSPSSGERKSGGHEPGDENDLPGDTGENKVRSNQGVGTLLSSLREELKRDSVDESIDGVRDAPPSDVSIENEIMSDSDMLWKSEYDPIKPDAPESGEEAAKGAPEDKFKESGEGVYDYLGGMVLQMDTAFALQMQELFGPVGFHLHTDALSPDDLKVKIGYRLARELHKAWSEGLEERFQSQEKQVEEMLQRDEELARRLQQEENLKKLAKAHRDKKPANFIAPGSPKRSKRRQKEKETGEGVANGGGAPEPLKGEDLLVGGGLRTLNELGVIGGAPNVRAFPPPVQRKDVPELAQIMAEEEIRQRRDKHEVLSNASPVRAGTIATKLKRDQLYETFPDVDKSVLEDIFKANNYDLQHTAWEVNAVYRDSSSPVKHVFSPEALAAMERAEQSPVRSQGNTEPDGQYQSSPVKSGGPAQYQSTEEPDYDDYRAEATLHYRQRDECFKKAAKAYHSGQKELAVHYSSQGHLHSVKLKEANRRAAEAILIQRKPETGENKLDLHNLHVEEALQALQEVLLEKEQQARRGNGHSGQQRYLEVVTGRGRHSQGGVAKLKPAVAKFLEHRGYKFTVPNAGCLRVYL